MIDNHALVIVKSAVELSTLVETPQLILRFPVKVAGLEPNTGEIIVLFRSSNTPVRFVTNV